MTELSVGPNHSSSVAEFTSDVFRRGLFAVIEWFAHCVVVATILAGMRGLQGLLHVLWGPGITSIRVLGVGLEELFVAADMVLLVGVLFLGGVCVVKAYKG